MIEEDFYATIKLKTGEEIFARVSPDKENSEICLLVNNPIIINQFKSRSGSTGYRIEPWLKTTTEDLFVLNMNDILTMTETTDIEIILLHQEFVSQFNEKKSFEYSKSPKENKISRKMGYISTINDAKKLLENIYKNS